MSRDLGGGTEFISRFLQILNLDILSQSFFLRLKCKLIFSLIC